MSDDFNHTRSFVREKLFFLICLGFVFLGCGSSNVNLVKDNTLDDACDGNTIEEMVDSFMSSPEWEEVEAEDGNEYVNVTGQITYAGKPVEALIQWRVSKDGESFRYQAFELNGVPQSDAMYLELMLSMCEESF
jgi:hypothetical protein